jgi:nitrite reductase/ring-hydroxylating ferredoxin subunit
MQSHGVKQPASLNMQDFDESRLWVTSSDKLVKGNYLQMDVLYAGEQIPVVIFRHKGKCLAYRNRCLHMPRKLDCELNTIFDFSGEYLRCSMHGIVYEPISGESISTMCNGERLTPIELVEDEHGVWIVDRRVSALVLT